eukprot:6173564-Pyramimonas_sp.AAC.1
MVWTLRATMWMLRAIVWMLRAYADLSRATQAWVFNVEPITEDNSKGGKVLPWLYDRGLLGLYHDWCEDFPAYPRCAPRRSLCVLKNP